MRHEARGPWGRAWVYRKECHNELQTTLDFDDVVSCILIHLTTYMQALPANRGAGICLHRQPLQLNLLVVLAVNHDCFKATLMTIVT